MATHRLYYDDCYLRQFDATVLDVDEDGGIELDLTAFYPESGGQAHDLGLLGGVPVLRVLDRDERVLHFASLDATPGMAVRGEIDWPRRFDLMQHHTAQHLLSAVAEETFGWSTVSVHMGPDNATVELAAEEIPAKAMGLLEAECNRRIQQNLPVQISVVESVEGLRLRKPTGRQGPVRVVSIAGLDQSACGGTHVRATGEIGSLFLGRCEKIRKNTRLEFACGMRAVSLARRNAVWLGDSCAVFQTSPDQIATVAAAQREEFGKLLKEYRALQTKQAKRDGEVARATLGHTGGIPVCVVRSAEEAIGEGERAFAQAFCGVPPGGTNGAILLTVVPASGAFLLCASADAGFDAKVWLAEAAGRLGAKGGGSVLMANGRLADPAKLPQLIAALPAPAIVLPPAAG